MKLTEDYTTWEIDVVEDNDYGECCSETETFKTEEEFLKRMNSIGYYEYTTDIRKVVHYKKD